MGQNEADRVTAAWGPNPALCQEKAPKPLDGHQLPEGDSSPVLTAPVSAVPALFATVRVRPGPLRPVKTSSSAAGAGFDGTEWARTRSEGRKQGQNSADGCGEDRASATLHARWRTTTRHGLTWA